MAKKQTFGDKVKKNQKSSSEDVNFFGTTRSMVVKEIKDKDGNVSIVAKDEKGHYMTKEEHIDSGLVDPFRCLGDRMAPTKKQLEDD